MTVVLDSPFFVGTADVVNNRFGPTATTTTPIQQTSRPLSLSQPSPPAAVALATPVVHAPLHVDGWALLRLHAETYNDCQQHRIALSNRLHYTALTCGPDGTPVPSPIIVYSLAAEKEAAKALHRAYKECVPANIRAWQAATPGIGEHQLARLLGNIGDPAIATPLIAVGKGADRTTYCNGDPYRRTVAQLWRYCGWDPTQRRRVGMSQADVFLLGRSAAKSISWQMAEACMKNRRSPYRPLYDESKAAKLGVEWSKGHAHMHGLRLMAKAILRDLWRAANNLPTTDHDDDDTQKSGVGGGGTFPQDTP